MIATYPSVFPSEFVFLSSMISQPELPNGRMYNLFGDQTSPLIDELNESLAA